MSDLWYASNHPWLGPGLCPDCGQAAAVDIHDDPSAGQDFDWKWGDPT